MLMSGSKRLFKMKSLENSFERWALEIDLRYSGRLDVRRTSQVNAPSKRLCRRLWRSRGRRLGELLIFNYSLHAIALQSTARTPAMGSERRKRCFDCIPHRSTASAQP